MLRFVCLTAMLAASWLQAVQGYEKNDRLCVIANPATQPGADDEDRVTFRYGDPVTVLAVEGERLRVSYFGRTGTVSPREVIPQSQAIDFFTTLLQAQHNPGDLVARGRVYVDNEEDSKGLTDLNEALRRDPQNVAGYVARANLWLGRGNIDNLYHDAEIAARLAPTIVDAMQMRAIARCNYAATRDKGLADYAEVLRREPNNYVALNNRSKTLIDLGRLDQAFADLNKALEVFPEYSDAFTNRGIVYHRRRQFDLAIRDATEAIKYNERNISAWNNRGNANIELKEFPHAVDDFAKLVEMFPERTEGYYGLANAYYLWGKLDDAKVNIEHLLKLTPDDYKAWNTKGTILKQQGDFPAAIKAFDEGVRLIGVQAQGWKDPSWPAVEECLQGKLERHPLALQFSNRTTLATILSNRADAYRNLIGKLPDAQRSMFDDITRAIVLHPENPAYFLARAHQNFHFRLFVEATSDFEQVLKINPQSVEAVKGHLLTALERKQYDIVRRDRERLKELGRPLDETEWQAIEYRISGKVPSGQPAPNDLSK